MTTPKTDLIVATGRSTAHKRAFLQACEYIAQHIDHRSYVASIAIEDMWLDRNDKECYEFCVTVSANIIRST